MVTVVRIQESNFKFYLGIPMAYNHTLATYIFNDKSREIVISQK